MKTIILSIIFCSGLLFSCSSLFRLGKKPKDFTYLYNTENTGLSKSLYTDGIFRSSNPKISKKYLVFFEDGLICSPDVLPTQDSIRIIYPKKIYDGYIWGRYAIEGDTLKIQTIYNQGLLDGGLEVGESFYKVINPKQIKWIGYISMHGDYFERDVIFNYEPLANRMDSSSCWLLKKKWFWTKEAWKSRNK